MNKKDNTLQKYIKQPYPLSSLATDLSLQQTHILVEMMDSVSNKIATMFESGSKLLFSESDFVDGIAHIDVDFRALTSRPDCYRDVEEIAKKMVSTQMEYTEQKAEGLTKIIINAFESVEIPKEGNRRQGIIRFNLTKKQATSLFDFTRYSKYLKSVARNTSSVYTARIYMLITAWRKFGYWNADYNELRKSLGCNEYDKEVKEWKPKKYAEYRQFKRRVLRTAEDELRKLAENGDVDCYFEFSEIYKDGRVSAQPEKIHFQIYTTSMGELENKKQEEAHTLYQLQEQLQSLLFLSDKECRQVLSKVDKDMTEQLSIRIKEISKSIERQGDKIRDKRKYALKSVYDAILEFTPKMEEVIDEDKNTISTTNDVQYSDPTNNIDHTKEDKELWGRVVHHFNNTDVAIPLEGMSLIRKGEKQYIAIPTQSFGITFKDAIAKVKEYTNIDIIIIN